MNGAFAGREGDARQAGCALCDAPGVPIWQDAEWRVVRVDDVPDFPAYYRVVAQRHVVELSDLPDAERERCMALVCRVEQVLRKRLRPDKVNLAALGNAVPHLHWHIVARFGWDSHYPQPIWGARQRDAAEPMRRLAVDMGALDAAMVDALVIPVTAVEASAARPAVAAQNMPA